MWDGRLARPAARTMWGQPPSAVRSSEARLACSALSPLNKLLHNPPLPQIPNHRRPHDNSQSTPEERSVQCHSRRHDRNQHDNPQHPHNHRHPPRPIVQPQQSKANPRTASRRQQKHVRPTQFQPMQQRRTQPHRHRSRAHQHDHPEQKQISRRQEEKSRNRRNPCRTLHANLIVAERKSFVATRIRWTEYPESLVHSDALAAAR